MTLTLKANRSELTMPGDYCFEGIGAVRTVIMACPNCDTIFEAKGSDPAICHKCPLSLSQTIITPCCGRQVTVTDGNAVLV